MEHMSQHFTVEHLPKSFGAVISDIDIRTLDDDQFAELYRIWIDRGLLIIPSQFLSDDEQRAFAERFGPLVTGLEAIEISNVKPDGSLRDAPDDDMMKVIRGNMQWHQDSTYMPVQAKGAVFSAKVVPSSMGDTAFADLRHAWDSLEPELQAQVQHLSAYHSLVHSQQKLGEATKKEGSEYIGYGLDVTDIPLRPLLKIHPESGKKTLALGRHAYGIPGLTPNASEELLNQLIDFSVADEYRVYQHKWSKGDVVVWDNRSLMHRACDWDFQEPRIMLHSRLAGDPATEGV